MKLLLNSPVEHDGKARAEGSMLELPDEQAHPLLAAGVATEVLEDVADTKPAKGKAKAAESDPA